MENNRQEKDVEELYSLLNVGSFMERKRKAKQNASLEDIPKKEALPKKVVEVPKEEKIEEKNVEEKAIIEEPKKEEKNVKVPVTKDVTSSEENKVRDILKKVEEKKENEITQKAEKKEIPKEIKKEEEVKEKKTISENELDELMEDFEEPNKKEKKTKDTKKSKKKIEENIVENELEDKENKKSKKKNRKDKVEKNLKKSKKLVIGVPVCILMDLFAIVGLFLTYGPISYFRDMLVTSAMTTMSHKYLARIFYSDEMISEILSKNKIVEIGENTDASDIDFGDATDTGIYDSVYDEEILKRDEDTLYKVIPIKENGYVGYLVAIYDASRVELVGACAKSVYGGAFLTDISKRENAKVAINASGFYDAGSKGSVAVGTVIMDGKVVLTGSSSGYGGGLAGFNKDHVLVLTKEDPETAIKNGMVDAVEFGPFLIVNGKAAEIQGNGGWGIASRTVLAQRKDGIVLFLVIDGRNAGYSLGIDMNGLIKILTRYKAYNAVNLDGGGSTTLAVEGKLTNKPCCSVDANSGQRYVPNAWIVK